MQCRHETRRFLNHLWKGVFYMTETSLEQFYINGNQNIKDAIDVAFKTFNYDKASDFLKLKVYVHDGQMSELEKFRQLGADKALMCNSVLNDFCSPVVPIDKSLKPFIILKTDFTEQPKPIMILGLSYAFVFIYHAITYENEIMKNDASEKTIFLQGAVSFFSEYKSYLNYVESYSDVNVESIKSTIVDSVQIPSSIPENAKNGIYAVHAYSYLAKLKAFRQTNKVSENETWEDADTFFAEKYGSNFSNVRELFFTQVNDFSELQNLSEFQKFLPNPMHQSDADLVMTLFENIESLYEKGIGSSNVYEKHECFEKLFDILKNLPESYVQRNEEVFKTIAASSIMEVVSKVHDVKLASEMDLWFKRVFGRP